MSHKVLTTAIAATQTVVGRQRLAKFARLLTNVVRLDTANDMATNGEGLVQRAALMANRPVVFDVGAHFGEWSSSLLAQPGNRPTLHAFEPSEGVAKQAVVILADKATVHRIGMSDESGNGVLNIVHDGAGSNSVVPFTTAERTSVTTEPIVLTTVDRFCQEIGLVDLTLLKIDAEGHDLAVMRGAASSLAAHSIGMVQFEYNWRWVESRSFLLDAFELLVPLGYSVGKVTSKGIETYPRWHPELESFREGNYLAFLPAWTERLPTFDWWGA